jgi:pimeloyl-ACP methyl ester carboxylesterase
MTGIDTGAATARDGDIELWYEVQGSNGLPLVLTGGFGLLDEQFHAVRPYLLEHFQVIDWHYRGSGNSTRDCSIGFDRWVEDLEVVLASIGVGEASPAALLWGTSTGSPITLAYAARYPERVQGVAVHPFLAGAAGRRVMDGFRAVGEGFGYEALALLTAWIGCAGEVAMEPGMLELARFEAAVFRRKIDLSRLGEILDELVAVDVTDAVSTLADREMPMLVLIGQSGRMGIDTKGAARAVEQFQALVPAAELSVIPAGGGTYCMIEQPEKSARALIDWVDRLAL